MPQSSLWDEKNRKDFRGPSSELLGYFQMSLRDNQAEMLAAAHCGEEVLRCRHYRTEAPKAPEPEPARGTTMSILNYLWKCLNPRQAARKPAIRCMRISRRLKTLVQRERAYPPSAGPIQPRQRAMLTGRRVRP
jgi:hypothetical protein